MDFPDDHADESIPDGAVLMTANNILNLLEYSEQLTDEEVLFSDEFYISILSNLLTDKKFDIKPGNSPEEKVKSLKKLLKLLGETIEMDLSQISAQGIIMEHDKASAKSFLELLEELIKTLMNANLEDEDESEKNDNKNDDKNDDMNIKENNEEIKNESSSEKNDIENKHFAKSNNSEGNIFGGNKNRFNLDDIDVENDNDLDNDIKKDENEENDKDNINKVIFNKEEEIDLNELKKAKEKEENLEKNNKKSGNNSIKNENNNYIYNNSSNEEIRISGESFHRLNQSNIEKLQLEKMFKNLENKNDESYIRKTYSQNDLSSYEKQLEEREEENEHENEEENENENENDNENDNEKQKPKSEEKSKKDILSSQEEVENKFDDDALNLNYNLEDKANISEAPIMNVSHISEFSHNNKNKDKEMEIEKTSDKKSNKKDTDENVENNSESKKSIKIIKTKSNKSTSNKNIESTSKKNIENIDDDLPDLFIDNKKSQNSNKFDYDEENDDENEEKNKNIKNNNNYFDEESNMEEEENFYVPHSVPRAYNKMHLPSASKETESSQRNNQKLIKESNSSLTNSNISFHSKHSKKSSHRQIDEFNDISNSSTNKKNAKIATNKKSSNKKSDHKISTNKKEESYVETKSNRSKRSQKSQRQTEDNDNENENEESENDISKSSVYTNAHEKSVKSTASKKSEASKKNKSITNSEKNKNSTSSKKSIKSSQKKFNYKDLLGIEIPMSDEEIKYEIKKELKKLYGEKAKQYFNKNFLDLIVENVKLTRKTILKLETGAEPDDFFSREFLLKYQKEIQKLLKYYVEEKKRENIYKQNAIMSIGQNIKFMKKLKEAELKNIINEIEYKKKEREMKNEEEQNQIMLYPSYCYELQKQIYLAETQNQIDIINYKENEKKNSILEMEKAYNDRLAILTELLRREKRERINQKRLNQRLEYELKSMSKRRLKKQVEDMLDQIDEENKKINNDDNNNQEEIEKILNHFV